MSDLDKRLDLIEEQLRLISGNQSKLLYGGAPPRNKEIDLLEILRLVWEGKWAIIAIAFLFSIVGVLFAFYSPNMYESEGVYAPAQKQVGVNGLASQYGGLAAIAGISLEGGDINHIEEAVVLSTSRFFMQGIISKYDLGHQILAVDGWDAVSNTVIWDRDLYNPENKEWLRENVVRDYEAYLAMKEMISVGYDKKTGLLTIRVRHYSPVVSRHFVKLFMEELNSHFQQRDRVESEKNIAYLALKVQDTSVSEMKSVFFKMIEAQTQSLMLAEVSEEYLLREVVAPVQPIYPSSPNRKLMVLMSVIIGAGFGVLLILLHAATVVPGRKLFGR